MVGSEIGDNALGQVQNYLASTLSGNLLIQNTTGLLLELNEVGRAAYRAQKARSYSFDVGVEAFVVSARSTGWLDTRTAALDIDAAVGFLEVSPGAMNPAGMQRMMLGENRLATSLTPLNTLPGIEFAKSVQYVGSDSYGRQYRAVVGLSTFAGMIPLADLHSAPGIGRDNSPVPVGGGNQGRERIQIPTVESPAAHIAPVLFFPTQGRPDRRRDDRGILIVWRTHGVVRWKHDDRYRNKGCHRITESARILRTYVYAASYR